VVLRRRTTVRSLWLSGVRMSGVGRGCEKRVERLRVSSQQDGQSGRRSIAGKWGDEGYAVAGNRETRRKCCCGWETEG